MLRVLAGVKDYCTDYKAVKFAIFYHDALPNEEQTAIFTVREMQKLSIDAKLIETVRKLRHSQQE